MELVLNEKEVKELLLDEVAKRFPGSFNCVELDTGYGCLRKATFMKVGQTEPVSLEPEVLAQPPFVEQYLPQPQDETECPL